MKSLNRVELIGNTGKEIEVRYTPQGTPVAKVSLATSHRYKDKSDQWVEKSEWHNLVLWQRLAEIAAEYVKKGDRIYVEGRIETRSWDDKQTGQKKYMTEIIVSDLILLGNRGESQRDRGDADLAAHRQSARSQSGGAVTPEDPIDDSDIPFIYMEMEAPECPRKWRKRR